MTSTDDKTFLKTHRCEGSLAANTPIRLQATQGVLKDKIGWWLCDVNWDFKYSVVFVDSIALIKFCPFCGVELPYPITQQET